MPKPLALAELSYTAVSLDRLQFLLLFPPTLPEKHFIRTLITCYLCVRAFHDSPGCFVLCSCTLDICFVFIVLIHICLLSSYSVPSTGINKMKLLFVRSSQFSKGNNIYSRLIRKRLRMVSCGRQLGGDWGVFRPFQKVQVNINGLEGPRGYI